MQTRISKHVAGYVTLWSMATQILCISRPIDMSKEANCACFISVSQQVGYSSWSGWPLYKGTCSPRYILINRPFSSKIEDSLFCLNWLLFISSCNHLPCDINRFHSALHHNQHVYQARAAKCRPSKQSSKLPTQTPLRPASIWTIISTTHSASRETLGSPGPAALGCHGWRTGRGILCASYACMEKYWSLWKRQIQTGGDGWYQKFYGRITISVGWNLLGQLTSCCYIPSLS